MGKDDNTSDMNVDVSLTKTEVAASEKNSLPTDNNKVGGCSMTNTDPIISGGNETSMSEHFVTPTHMKDNSTMEEIEEENAVTV